MNSRTAKLINKVAGAMKLGNRGRRHLKRKWNQTPANQRHTLRTEMKDQL